MSCLTMARVLTAATSFSPYTVPQNADSFQLNFDFVTPLQFGRRSIRSREDEVTGQQRDVLTDEAHLCRDVVNHIAGSLALFLFAVKT